uniref:Enoyl-ACP reductase n=1 Tax=Lotharella oceanica TaxID=641309 RepID=A0A7S2TFP2_9EUKA|mmetsp:Transcript_10179/g.19547  ORF Transcript_10179/g.19547 Transcript_10179/m.19547 type:complete len:413 (+) Transcript_10179:71-1309(+)
MERASLFSNQKRKTGGILIPVAIFALGMIVVRALATPTTGLLSSLAARTSVRMPVTSAVGASIVSSGKPSSKAAQYSSFAPLAGARSSASLGRSMRGLSSCKANGLPIDLKGKKAFVAGVADDQGFAWAISKCLIEAGADVSLGIWVPALGIFKKSLQMGKFDESRKLSDGSLMEFEKLYALDAVYDTPEDVPEEVMNNKRYAGNSDWTVSEVAKLVEKDIGKVDILVHSLANGPEVKKPLLETSRQGYLAAQSASAYSLVSMMQNFGPIMNEGGSVISLTYDASNKVVPGYGGGMSSAKASLESDTRVLAYEAGRKYKVRVNTISAGPLGSRAARAIGFIEKVINYSYQNAPISKELTAMEVGQTAAFLLSPLSSAITGQVIYVDNGLSTMGLGLDSPTLVDAEAPEPVAQ